MKISGPIDFGQMYEQGAPILLGRVYGWFHQKNIAMKTQSNAQAEQVHIAPFSIRQGLVGLSLDQTDEKTLEYLSFLTGKISAEALYFLHVVPDSWVRNPFPEEIEIDTSLAQSEWQLSDSIIGAMKAQIDKWLGQKQGCNIEFDLRHGDPLEEFLHQAQELNVDLAVVGKDTRSGDHGIIGRKLVRKVQANALVIPDRAKPGIHRIVVPVDFSQNSKRAMEAALSLWLALDQEPELIALHVYELPSLSSYRLSRPFEHLKKIVEGNIRDGFEAWTRTFFPEHTHAIRRELHGRDMPSPAPYILEAADELAADFIVMGAKGHSKVELLLMGSVTEKLLTINDNYPVLVVK